MMNDVTYLMGESLSELTQIHNIQIEMEDTAAWQAQTLEYRRDREQSLRTLEQHASTYTTLGSSTVSLLKDFTAETTTPFMMPEIVDRLAAMLDYNLDALAGPRCQNLVVKDRDKLKFDPGSLLSDILQIFLNLSDEEIFVTAVAGDGRSYRKELFDRAIGIAAKKAFKTNDELEKLRLFVKRVEAVKASLEAEEDLGDVPEEFLGPRTSQLPEDVNADDTCRPIDVHGHAKSGPPPDFSNHR
jgi:ubiquitin conjugation factor E4 B